MTPKGKGNGKGKGGLEDGSTLAFDAAPVWAPGALAGIQRLLRYRIRICTSLSHSIICKNLLLTEIRPCVRSGLTSTVGACT